MSTAIIQAVPLPWQSSAWQRLSELNTSERLPHAILLCGATGTGKLQFARALASYLLCSAPSAGLPCYGCRNCQLVEAGSHPDLRWLQPEEAGKRIKVDQVRQLVDFLGQTSQFGAKKIALVSPAGAMNTNAANALLKSLEEPAPETILVLVADSPARLLPTIRSRCQTVSLPMPSAEQSMAWLTGVLGQPEKAQELLDQACGQPLTALGLVEDGGLERNQQLDKGFYALQRGQQSVVTLVEQWREYELVDILTWMLRRTQDLIRHIQAGTALAKPWSLLAEADCRDLFRFLDRLSILLFKLEQGAVPNRQLALEEVLLVSCDIFHK